MFYKRIVMTAKVSRVLFVPLILLCFTLAQLVPFVSVKALEPCAAKSAGQKLGQSKRGCCCCGASHCPCDLKKGEANLPSSSDLAFDTKVGYQSFEEVGFLCVTVNKRSSDEIVLATFWTFARAPCPTIYLSNLNFLC